MADPDWKQHPVIIAAGSVAAALVFAYNVMFPTLTASLQNEVSSLRSQAQEMSKLREQIKQLETTMEDYKKKLAEAQTNNLFALGNPYPNGLGKVRIGDRIEAITSMFPEDKVERATAQYWNTKQQHAGFSSVTYFFDRVRDLKERRVASILFHGASSLEGVLHNKMVDAFGQPSVTGPKTDCFIWKVDKYYVRRESPRSFSIDAAEINCAIQEK